MMSAVRILAGVIIASAVAAGSLLDDVRPRRPHRANEFTVLAADLHVHSFFGDGGVAPWELPREAMRRGLDVIVVSNHNQRVGARIAAAAGNKAGGPIVIVGQEITSPAFHIAAAGLSETVDWRLTARDAIRAVHGQGGIAIAAHPVTYSWRAHDDEALALLDGAEVSHPLMVPYPLGRIELERFYSSAARVNSSLAAIGSSDFHFGGSLGLCRTFVFAREASERGVFDAVRAGRTVALGPRGELTGEPSLVRIVQGIIAADPPVTRAPPLARALSWIVLAAVTVVILFR